MLCEICTLIGWRKEGGGREVGGGGSRLKRGVRGRSVRVGGERGGRYEDRRRRSGARDASAVWLHCRIFPASAVPEKDPALLPPSLVSPPSVASCHPSSLPSTPSLCLLLSHMSSSLLTSCSRSPLEPPSTSSTASSSSSSSSHLIRIMSSLAPPTSCTQRPRSPCPEAGVRVRVRARR